MNNEEEIKKLKLSEYTKAYCKEYRLKNKEILKAKKQNKIKNNPEYYTALRKSQYIRNRKKVLEDKKKYYQENKERLTDTYKAYRDENKDVIKLRKKSYRINNREKINNHFVERYHSDLNFKLSQNLRNRLKYALKAQGCKKSKKSFELFGASVDIIWKHLESQFREGMTKENHGYRGWHVDHIVPCSYFDQSDPEQQKKCWHYTNLQPLWWWENLSKGDKLVENKNPIGD